MAGLSSAVCSVAVGLTRIRTREPSSLVRARPNVTSRSDFGVRVGLRAPGVERNASMNLPSIPDGPDARDLWAAIGFIAVCFGWSWFCGWLGYVKRKSEE